MNLKTQKQMIILFIIAFGIVLWAWWSGVFPFNRDPNGADLLIVERYHRGHLYLQDLRFNGGGALTHSPDCPCHKKGGNDER